MRVWAFDLGQPAGSTTNQTVTPKGSGLTFNFANSAATGVVLRANLTDGSTTWCTDVSSVLPSCRTQRFT